MPEPERERVTGVLLGLNHLLTNWLQSFDPGLEGICQIDPNLVINLPLPYWGVNAWAYHDTINIAAGETDLQVVYTVPMGERKLMRGVRCAMASGDNLLDYIELEQPAAYTDGDQGGALYLVLLQGGDGNLWWPDYSGSLTELNAAGPPGPILLEPGAVIRVKPDGTGASASVIRTQIIGEQFRIIPAVAQP